MQPPKPQKKKPTRPTSDQPPDPDAGDRSQTRRTRIGLFLLLLLTAGFAAGTLFVRYKLEAFRAVIEARAELETGGRFEFGSVVVNGLRGLKVNAFEVAFESPEGPAVRVKASSARVDLDLVDLLYGAVTVDQIRLDEAELIVSRPENRRWFAFDDLDLTRGSRWLGTTPFRVVISDGTLDVRNVVGDTSFRLDDFSVDISRLSDMADIRARLSGNLGGMPDKVLDAKVWFTSLDDFDVRLHCKNITAEDVNVFLPASQRLVSRGTASALVRLEGWPGDTVVLSIETGFRDIVIRNQPAFTPPVTGRATLLADYDRTSRVLSIETAKINSGRLTGVLDGSICFADSDPELNLHLGVEKLPATRFIQAFWPDRFPDFGELRLAVEEPCEVELGLEGTASDPIISGSIDIVGGRLAFNPEDTIYPSGELELGQIKAFWEPDNPMPKAKINVVSGTLSHDKAGIRAEDIKGIVNIENNRIFADTFNATVRGNPFVLGLKYEPDNNVAELSATGVIAGLEDIPVAAASKHFGIEGSASVDCRARIENGRCTVTGKCDLTQSRLDFMWWFSKPRGVGASAQNLRLEFVPGETATISGDAFVAASRLHGQVDFVQTDGGEWKPRRAEVNSDLVDISTASKCIKIPYTISGSTVRDGRLTWERQPEPPFTSRLEISGLLDEVSLLPEGGQTRMRGRGVDVKVTQVTGEDLTGNVEVAVEDARMPPLGDVWFIPLKSDPAILDKYPDRGRKWTFDLAADTLQLPPWKGADFTGVAYSRDEEAGLTHFGADVAGGGVIEGSYHNEKPDNAYRLSARWNEIPVHYLIEHLGYPKIMTGTTTGNVSYALDRDDPNTLNGTGRFEVHNGEFSADYLLAQLEQHLDHDASALPPSLDFKLFRSDVELEQDTVKTPDVQLVSEGLRISGSGHFVRDGDMKYLVEVTISPELAERVPALRDSFNIQGLRLAQQDIQLSFKISGPTFRPRGEVAELPPIGITLVSGALEVTSEAVKVIDMPRRILLDLLRIGGGIVGTQR